MRKPILKQNSRKHLQAAAVVKMFRTVRAEYDYSGEDVFNEDEPRVAALKRIISELDQVDRTIIVLYCELQSTEELGRILHVSKRTAARAVKRIREDILKRYENLQNHK